MFFIFSYFITLGFIAWQNNYSSLKLVVDVALRPGERAGGKEMDGSFLNSSAVPHPFELASCIPYGTGYWSIITDITQTAVSVGMTSLPWQLPG